LIKYFFFILNTKCRILNKKRKLGSNSFITTQPGIIATIYLSPIALLKNKTPYILENHAFGDDLLFVTGDL